MALIDYVIACARRHKVLYVILTGINAMIWAGLMLLAVAFLGWPAALVPLVFFAVWALGLAGMAVCVIGGRQ